jgi:hypothetical protein
VEALTFGFSNGTHLCTLGFVGGGPLFFSLLGKQCRALLLPLPPIGFAYSLQSVALFF